MKINILASGSKGNCCYIKTKEHNILIDLGISNKRIVEGLTKIGVDYREIDIICITHEHSDHVNGLAQFLKKSSAKIYLTEGTYSGIITSKNLDNANAIFAHNQKGLVRFLKKDYLVYETINLKGLNITGIATFHDSLESCGFVFDEDNCKVVYITDTGYVHKDLEPLIEGADCYVLETNHDPTILMSSARPYPLKMRILSDHGHMSNEDAFILLSKVIKPNTKYVFCAHISEECNMTDIIDYTKNLVYKKLEFGIETEYIFTSQLQSEVYEI